LLPSFSETCRNTSHRSVWYCNCPAGDARKAEFLRGWQARGLSAIRAISAPPFARRAAAGSHVPGRLPAQDERGAREDSACALRGTADRPARRLARPLRDGHWIRERSATANMGSPFRDETKTRLPVCCGCEA